MHPIQMPRPSARLPGRALWAVASLVALAAFAAPAAADVYKWVDPQGRVHYSDLPPPADGKLLSFEATTGGPRAERPAPPAAPARPVTPAATQPLPPPGGDELAKLKQSVNSDLANTRAAQCKEAQDRYQNYVNSRRIYKEGPNKERVYLSDAELETARVNARREVDDLCGEAPH